MGIPHRYRLRWHDDGRWPCVEMVAAAALPQAADDPAKRQLMRIMEARKNIFFAAALGLCALGTGIPAQAQQSQAGNASEADDVWLGGEVALSDLSGARINSHWFRYVNSRFGLAIDIPTKGYRYTVPVNGSGLTLTSLDGEIWITIYNHFGPNIVDNANNDARNSIAKLFDSEVSDTRKANGTIEYSVRKDDFYVISGRFGSNTYYERLTISRECPDIINAVRIFHPTRLERRLHQLTTRLSTSLTATCNGAG